MDEFGPDDDEERVGYCRPPKRTRFVKGRSGNPAGRPRGRRNRHPDAPYAAVLERMVTIREGGQERKVAAAEAFLLHLAKRGVEGDAVAARTALAVIEQARAKRRAEVPLQFFLVPFSGGVNQALEDLEMATKLDPHSESARMALEPWIVEAALARLPEPLTPEQQRVIVAATRLPHRVRWPEWWSEHP